MDQNLRRSIILDHYQHPRHRGLIEDDTYQKSDTRNESCIDEIHLMAKVEDQIMKDIRFDGEACAICMSSTSVMIQTLLGKNLTDAKKIIQSFEHMIEQKEYDARILEQAIVYDDIYKQPNRKTCALLPWWGIKKIIEKEDETNE